MSIEALQQEFEMAAYMGAHYRAMAEKWEETRRLDERVQKSIEVKDDAVATSQTLLTAIMVSGVRPREYQQILERVGLHQNLVIEALQEKQEELDASQGRLDDMLGDAYELEDGRRVFKTEDGLRVFDEHGFELSADTIDPDEIENWRPKAETYFEEVERRNRIVQEQAELLDYQDKLDAAQDKLDQGTLSRDEYNELNDLLNTAPTALRNRLPQDDPAYQAPTPRENDTSVDFSGLEEASPGLMGQKFR